MKKRLKIIALLLVAVVVGIATWIFCQPAEPTYKGRTLTSYLRGPWEQIDGPQTDNPHYAPNEVAIRAIGTNGIPTLLRLIGAHDPPWKAKVIYLLNNQKLVHLDILPDYGKRVLGHSGFIILGELAASAGPALVKLLNNSDLEVRRVASAVLLQLPTGTDAHQAAIKELLHEGDFRVRDTTLEIFKKRFPDEIKADPLKQTLEDWEKWQSEARSKMSNAIPFRGETEK